MKKAFRILLLMAFLVVAGCGLRETGREVVVYTSVDQVFSEPVLKDFEKSTGIRVKVVYDVEAAKTTGLVNRLITEAANPQADVFWSGEFVQTMLLHQKGILTPYKSPMAEALPVNYRDADGYWNAMAGRARVMLVNTSMVARSDYPKSIFDLPSCKVPAAKIGIAHPLFGTAATHAAALYASLGAVKAHEFFQKIQTSGIKIVAGNSVVRDMVVSGQLAMGLVDTDDACGAVERGAPVEMVFLDQDEFGTLVIPNTVCMIGGSRHQAEAHQLIDYLLSRETEEKMIRSGWSQIPVCVTNVVPAFMPETRVKGMDVSFRNVYGQLDKVKSELRELFVQ